MVMKLANLVIYIDLRQFALFSLYQDTGKTIDLNPVPRRIGKKERKKERKKESIKTQQREMAMKLANSLLAIWEVDPKQNQEKCSVYMCSYD